MIAADLWTVVDWFNSDFSLRLTRAMAHFLWQGCAIAVVYAAVDWCLKRRAANVRYIAAVAALALMAACLPATMLLSAPEIATVETTLTIPTDSPAPVALDTALGTAQSAWERQTERAATMLAWASPYASAGYLCGALLMLVRVSLGLWGGQRLRRASAPVHDEDILALVRQHAARMRLRVVPIVALSQRISAPVVVGVWRPMILLPAALLAGLMPDQLQAVLLHELAHVRRYDLAVNVMQRIIEAMLFFHPAVWWLSRRVSVQRELACDDFVLGSGWQRVKYAETLIRVAELSSATPDGFTAGAALLAATGKNTSQFKRRIIRLLGQQETPRLRVTKSGVLLVALIVAFAVIVPATWPSLANSLAGEDGEVSADADVAVEPPAERSKTDNAVIKAARQGFEAARAAYETDTLPLETLAQWSERLLSAEDHAASTPKDHLAAELHHLQRMKQLQAKVTALHGAGARGGEAEKKALMDYYVADAERRLAQFDSERAAPKAASSSPTAGRSLTGTWAPKESAVPAARQGLAGPAGSGSALATAPWVSPKPMPAQNAAELARREQKLKQVLMEKSDQLLREMKEVQRMSEVLGIVDPSAAAAQNQMLQVHLSTLNNSIFGLRGQLSNLEVEIERCTIDIQLAQDATAKEARAEEEVHKDELLKKLADRLNDLELAIEEAQSTPKGEGKQDSKGEGKKEDPAAQRLMKQKAALEEKIELRRDTLLKKFSDSVELVKVKEFEGKKRAFEKHRDSLKEQLAKQEEAEVETRDKLKVISRDTADLEARRRRIRSLEQFMDRIDRELQDTWLERQLAPDDSRQDQK